MAVRWRRSSACIVSLPGRSLLTQCPIGHRDAGPNWQGHGAPAPRHSVLRGGRRKQSPMARDLPFLRPLSRKISGQRARSPKGPAPLRPNREAANIADLAPDPDGKHPVGGGAYGMGVSFRLMINGPVDQASLAIPLTL